jgi:hypothetical protein
MSRDSLWTMEQSGLCQMVTDGKQRVSCVTHNEIKTFQIWHQYIINWQSHIPYHIFAFLGGKNSFVKEMGTRHINSNLLKSMSGTHNIRAIGKSILKLPECKSKRKFSGCPQFHSQSPNSANYTIAVKSGVCITQYIFLRIICTKQLPTGFKEG